MLFKQSELTGSCLDEAIQLIDNSSFLFESESFYHPSMVSVRENQRLGLNLIKMEDLVEYSLANGICDAEEAVRSVCEENSIDLNTIGFSVNETSIITDPEMADTVRFFKENGLDVYVNQISSLDPVYQLSSSIVEAMINNAGTNNEEYFDHLFESFILDESYDEILSESEIIDNIKSKAEGIKNSVTQAATDAKNYSAKKLASLKSIYRQLKGKLSSAYGSAKQTIRAQMDKVSQGIDYLKNKISSEKDKK